MKDAFHTEVLNWLTLYKWVSMSKLNIPPIYGFLQQITQREPYYSYLKSRGFELFSVDTFVLVTYINCSIDGVGKNFNILEMASELFDCANVRIYEINNILS